MGLTNCDTNWNWNRDRDDTHSGLNMLTADDMRNSSDYSRVNQ